MTRALGLIAFAVLLAALTIYLSNRWGHKVTEPEYLPNEAPERDFESRVDRLTYGDISEKFVNSIDPDLPDVPFSETHHGDAPRGEFGPGSVFSLPEPVKEHIKKAENKGKYYE